MTDFQAQYSQASALYSDAEIRQHLADHVRQTRNTINAEWGRRHYKSAIGTWAKKTIAESIHTLRTAGEMATWLEARA